MKSNRALWGALALGLGLISANAARAQNFNIITNVAAGTFTFTDSNPNDPVFEVVVAGLGSSAGTTQPGFSAEAFNFFLGDPLNCQAAIGSTISSGFCYAKTNPAASPITGGSTVFTYDNSFDLGFPEEFAVAFDTPGGGTGACFGQTGAGAGCSAATVPEPPSIGIVAPALLGMLGLLGWRRHRPAFGLKRV